MNKRKNLYIIIGIAVVIIPILISIGAYAIYDSKNKPEYKWNEYVELLKEKDYEKMYDLLDSTAKAKVTEEEFVSRNKNIYEGINAENIEMNVTSVESNGSDKIVNYDTSMDTIAGNLTFFNSVKLTRELRRGYTIKWNSNVIFKDLDDGDKVRVNTVKADRGQIIDRNGETLASDSYISCVGIVPGKLNNNKDKYISKIAQILGVSTDYINSQLNMNYVKDDTFVPIKDILYGSDKTTALMQIPCIMIQEKNARVYKYGKETAHLLGYVQPISREELEANKDKEYNANSVIGKSGLEKMYEDTLRGIDGEEIYIQNSQGEKKETILKKETKNGSNLKLTIDMNMQKLLYDQISDDKGTAVAMNPDNGELLALVSTPTFDSNEFVIGLSNDEWNKLNNDERKPMYNRFQATLAPGSSFKPITAAIGVDTKKIDPNAVKQIDGLSWQKDSSWGNYYVTRVSSYDNANMENALVYSDNIYFAQAALDIGSDTMKEKLKSFGFGENIPCDYNLYNSQISSTGDFANDIMLADSGYGQGEVLVNPIHLASLYTMFENGGNMLTPKLVIGDDYDSNAKIWKENVISKDSADLVLNDLIKVVENPSGTGHQSYTSGLTIAGKTGTAEIKKSQDDTTGTELGWFVGMTTNKKPNNLLVAMMAEDVKDRGGSHYVVPKVKAALETVK